VRSILSLALNSTSCIALAQDALSLLTSNKSHHTIVAYREVLLSIFKQLDASWGGSVLQCQAPLMGTDALDIPISDNEFFATLLTLALHLGDNVTHETIKVILNWTDPGAFGYYDYLGGVASDDHPHLDEGQGHETDPSYYFTPVQQAMSVGTSTPWRWGTYTQTFYDDALSLHYHNLDPATTYQVTIVYVAAMSNPPVRLVDGRGVVVHDYLTPTSPPLPRTYVLPYHVTKDGNLTLRVESPQGRAGNGAHAMVSEVWLTGQGILVGPCALGRLNLSPELHWTC